MKTLEDIEQVRELAAQLDEQGAPRRITDGIRRWANKEQKRLRDEAREKA